MPAAARGASSGVDGGSGAVTHLYGTTGAYGPDTEPSRLPTRELSMADKSPRHSMSKKSGKSLKEKRVERKTKADHASQMERLTRDKKT